MSSRKKGTYYDRNRERVLARYRKKRTQLLAYQHAWIDKNLERVMWQGAKERAKTKGLPFNITVDDIMIPDVCPVFGLPFVRGTNRNHHNLAPTLDRFLPALGYVKGNVHVISRLANMIKSSATTHQVRAVAEWMQKVETSCPSLIP